MKLTGPQEAIIPLIQPCPVCGRQPDVDECCGFPKDAGPRAWYANCYRTTPREHCVGVTGDSRLDVVRRWNVEVAKIESLQSEPQ